MVVVVVVVVVTKVQSTLVRRARECGTVVLVLVPSPIRSSPVHGLDLTDRARAVLSVSPRDRDRDRRAWVDLEIRIDRSGGSIDRRGSVDRSGRSRDRSIRISISIERARPGGCASTLDDHEGGLSKIHDSSIMVFIEEDRACVSSWDTEMVQRESIGTCRSAPRPSRRRRRSSGRTRAGGTDARGFLDARSKQTIMALATIGKPMTFTVRAARHANKKATKGHRDTRPKKSSPSQRKRTPTEYPKVDPASVPAVMTVVSK